MNNNVVIIVREMFIVILFIVIKILGVVWKVACLGITVIFVILFVVSIVYWKSVIERMENVSIFVVRFVLGIIVKVFVLKIVNISYLIERFVMKLLWCVCTDVRMGFMVIIVIKYVFLIAKKVSVIGYLGYVKIVY